MSMFKLIAVTDQASCPENFWTQLQLLAASEIDALIFRAKELPPQEYYRQAPPEPKNSRAASSALSAGLTGAKNLPDTSAAADPAYLSGHLPPA